MTYVEWSDTAMDRTRRWWHQSVPADAGSIEHAHLPYGGVEVRWRRGEVPEVVGPSLSLVVETLVGGSDVVGVRFAPGRWPDLPHCSLLELVGECVAMTDVVGASIAADIDDSPHVRRAALRGAINAVLNERPTEALVIRAVDLLRVTDIPVGNVAESVDLSERQARRRIRATTGLAARELRQLARFQRFVANVQEDVAKSARRAPVDHAHAAGYADQSHLSRACRALAGQTPKQYLDQTHHHCADHQHHTF